MILLYGNGFAYRWRLCSDLSHIFICPFAMTLHLIMFMCYVNLIKIKYWTNCFCQKSQRSASIIEFTWIYLNRFTSHGSAHIHNYYGPRLFITVLTLSWRIHNKWIKRSRILRNSSTMVTHIVLQMADIWRRLTYKIEDTTNYMNESE